MGGGGGGGLNYFHRKFRQAHHETKYRQPGLGYRGWGSVYLKLMDIYTSQIQVF